MSQSCTKIKPPVHTWKGRLLDMMVSLISNFHCRKDKPIRENLHIHLHMLQISLKHRSAHTYPSLWWRCERVRGCMHSGTGRRADTMCSPCAGAFAEDTKLAACLWPQHGSPAPHRQWVHLSGTGNQKSAAPCRKACACSGCSALA